MKTQTEKFNEEITNKIFKNSRGNFVHIKLINKHEYPRKERKFDLCEATTIEGSIEKTSGSWAFTNDIKRLIKQGKFVLVK